MVDSQTTRWANGREHCNWCADNRQVQIKRGWGNWSTESCPVCVTGEGFQVDATSWVFSGKGLTPVTDEPRTTAQTASETDYVRGFIAGWQAAWLSAWLAFWRR